MLTHKSQLFQQQSSVQYFLFLNKKKKKKKIKFKHKQCIFYLLPDGNLYHDVVELYYQKPDDYSREVLSLADDCFKPSHTGPHEKQTHVRVTLK